MHEYAHAGADRPQITRMNAGTDQGRELLRRTTGTDVPLPSDVSEAATEATGADHDNLGGLGRSDEGARGGRVDRVKVHFDVFGFAQDAMHSSSQILEGVRLQLRKGGDIAS
jgi:hypothetical protein